MSSVGSSLMGPDTQSALRIQMTVPQRKLFTGVGRENMKKKELQAVNGDFISLPRVFFSSLKNQSLIDSCPKPACLALPQGKTVMLFTS